MANDVELRIEALERALADERAARVAREARVRRWGWRAVVLASVLGAGAVLTRTELAHAACAATLPSPLTTFCPNEPARASTVNGNFKVVADAIANKVGALTSPDATMTKAITTSIVASPTGAGTVTVGSDLTVTGNTTLGGPGVKTALKGSVTLYGATVTSITIGTAYTAPADGLVQIAFSNSVACNPTYMRLTVAPTGAERAVATSNAGCASVDYAASSSLFSFVRAGETYKVYASGGSYTIQGASYIPFGS